MKIKSYILGLICLCPSLLLAQNSSNRSMEIENMYKSFLSNIPELADLMPIIESQKIGMVNDTIPEAYDLYEKAIPLINNVWNNDIEKLNNDFHEFLAIYTQNQHKFSKNSWSHVLANMIWAIMGIASGNDKWIMDGLLACDNYFQQDNPTTIFRCVTIPKIAELNIKIGNVDNAIEWQKFALRIVEENNAENTLFHAITLCNLADYLAEKKSYNDCERLYNKAFDILESINSRKWLIAGLYTNYMRYLLSNGFYEKIPDIAVKIESLINRNDIGDIETALQADACLFPYQFLLSENNDSAKVTLFRIFSSISLLFKNRFVFMARQIRDNYWDSTIEPYYDYLNMAANLYMDDPEYTIKMYDAQLQYKGAKLCTSISFERLVHESQDLEVNKLYEEYIENERIVQTLRNSLDSVDAVERYQRNFRNFNIENDLLKKISSEGSIVDWANCTYETVRTALESSDIAIEFFAVDALGNDFDGNTYYALLARKYDTSPQLIKVATEEEISKLDNLSSIYDVIWKPILDNEENKNVVNVYFSPSGILNKIPIEHALSIKKENLKGFRLSSTRELMSVSKEDKEINTAALFGGIIYDKNNPKYDYLPKTLKEVETVNLYLRSLTPNSYTGLDATEDIFKSFSGNSPNVILLSTHGGYSRGGDAKSSMKNTYIQMSGCVNLQRSTLNKGEEDGFLHANEIENLDLRNTDLVVLSACQSGLGNVDNEGVYGLQRGFKKSGVKSLLMTLWDVDDKAAYKFISSFFEHYSKTRNKYESYDIALKKTKKKYKNYKVWGAFVLMDAI